MGNAFEWVITFDAMHGEEWTEREVMGMQSQLSKLVKIFRSAEGK
jgi:hypothetical protein